VAAAPQHPNPQGLGLGGEFLGEPGFADPSLAGHQQQPSLALQRAPQGGAEPAQLGLTADEGARGRSLGGRVEDRWRRQVGMGQGDDLLGSRQPLELVGAGIGQGRGGRQLIGHQLRGRPRQQDLTALRQGPHTGRPVQRRPVVVPTALLSLPGMEGRPGGKRDAAKPHFSAQCKLQRQRGLHRISRSSEDREGRIPFPTALDEPAVVGRHCLGNQLLVTSQGGTHRHSVCLPQRRGPLDIGEQEGDDAVG
jgi:hypothetical protein